jgi:deoxyribodipyrimidine photo-lyase
MDPIAFPTELHQVLLKLDYIDPEKYAHDRNYVDGSVTYLSPYISRGMISTKMVFEHLVCKRAIDWKKMYKFIQELAWREYFQRVWQAKGNLDTDLKQPQEQVSHHEMPVAVDEARTGIEAIDEAILRLYGIGYLHNHLRMYIASITCNAGQSHWHLPAKWMYYHLLDADWASNALSWQWVSGAFSQKKYYANQGNINKFTYSGQRNTFLDTGYEQLFSMQVPDVLKETKTPELITDLPDSKIVKVDANLPTLIYDFYNIDPLWRKEMKANRILLLEPSHFKRYPVSEKSIRFILELVKNIAGIQLFTGEFKDLEKLLPGSKIYFKEHPLHRHYKGEEDQRDWLFPEVSGYFPSFFKFWKRCEKTLKEKQKAS